MRSDFLYLLPDLKKPADLSGLQSNLESLLDSIAKLNTVLPISHENRFELGPRATSGTYDLLERSIDEHYRLFELVDSKKLILWATEICGNTREGAFSADFAATTNGGQTFTDEFIRLIAQLHEAIRSSSLLLRVISRVLRAAGNEYAAKIGRYSESTHKRFMRIDCMKNESLRSVYWRMWSDAYWEEGLEKPERPTDYKVGIRSPNDELYLSTAHWIAHRLTWIATELRLESGPFIAALRQQLSFFDQQSVLFDELIDCVNKSELPPRGDAAVDLLEEMQAAHRLQENARESLRRLLDSPRSQASSEIAKLSEEDARDVTDDLRINLLSFLSGFQQAIEAYCNSPKSDERVPRRRLESLPSTEYQELISSPSSQIRVLLTQEPNAPRKWSAVGLDLRFVAFGETKDEALQSLAEIIEFEKKLNPQVQSRRLNVDTFERFNKAKEFRAAQWESKFVVHSEYD